MAFVDKDNVTPPKLVRSSEYALDRRKDNRLACFSFACRIGIVSDRLAKNAVGF